MSSAAPVTLLVSDVDRTLLTHDHVLPQAVVDAVARLGERGVRVILASARSPQALRPYAERLGLLDLAACFNGGWIGSLRTGTAISSIPIEREDALSAMGMARELGLNALWYGPDGVSVIERNAIIDREIAITGERLSVVGAIDALPGRPGKIMCVRADEDDGAFDILETRLARTLSAVRSHRRLLEINPAGVSKRMAIEFLAARLGVGRNGCAAAGDAENDIGMLRWAGLPLTVGNAIDEIKGLAAYVGPSCDEGGMAVVADWLIDRLERPTHDDKGGERNG